MKIGLIQTRGIGDVIIALPIAQHHIAQGHEVFWPVDADFAPFLQRACPEVKFLPIDGNETGRTTLDYFYTRPAQLLAEQGCERVVCLYSYLSGLEIVNARLAESLKFDEYKYAVAGVPFAEKWKLRIERDRAAEQRLREQLGITGPYVIVHNEGSNFKLDIRLPEDVTASHQVVHITPVTPNPFDWLGVLEGASMLVMIDSCFANLVEQLDLGRNRHFFLRSKVNATPVFRNAWTFH